MERGQASIEWLGAIALVALVLAGAAGVAGGDAIASSVVRGMHRALCIVRSGVCDLDRRPCVVEANATRDEAHLNLFFVRVGRDELILREHRSDGSVLVTYLHDTSSGWDVGVGADLWVSAAGRQMVAGSAARLALLASLGGGETWAFDDPLDADVAMAQLSEGAAPTLGRRVGRIAGTGLELAATAQGSWKGFHGMAGADGRRVHGTLTDAATGHRTHVLRRDAGVEALIGRLGAQGTASAATEYHLSITTDGRGRPLELTLVRSGELGTTADVPDVAQGVADAVVGRGGARRWVVEQRLDLTDPASAEVAGAALAALDAPLPMLADAGDALRARLDAAGVTEARTYAVSRDASGVVGHGSLGVKVGGGLTDATESARLVDARVLGPDGAWRASSACRAS